MQTYGLIPGFKYLHRTSSEDVAVARVPTEGIQGVLGKKNERVLRRSDPGSISKCCSDMLLQSPPWGVEDGTVQHAQNEVERWAHPELYEMSL